MSRKLFNKKKYKIAILIVLFISIISNIILIANYYDYKYRAGKEAYNNVLNIRTMNETNNEILTKMINVGSVSNVDLLKLYQNYDHIITNLSNLWYEYSYYVDSNVLFSDKKDINTDTILVSEIHTRIDEYLKVLLENEMTTETYKVDLQEGIMEDFQLMKYVSDDVKEYFDKFSEKNLKGLEGEKRIKKIIEEDYWIDILEELSKISDKYIDLDLNVNMITNIDNKNN